MIAFKCATIIVLTLLLEFAIQERLPFYGSDPLISSLAQVALRSGLGIAFAISYGRYLGMWRRVSGRSTPWLIAAVLLVPCVTLGVMMSAKVGLLVASPWIRVLCFMMWIVLAWSARDVGGALDVYYQTRTSSVAALDRIATGVPDRISRRWDMVGLDVAQIALSALAWYAMKAALSLG